VVYRHYGETAEKGYLLPCKLDGQRLLQFSRYRYPEFRKNLRRNATRSGGKMPRYQRARQRLLFGKARIVGVDKRIGVQKAHAISHAARPWSRSARRMQPGSGQTERPVPAR